MERGYGFAVLALGTVKSNGNKKIYITNRTLGKSFPSGTKVLKTFNKTTRQIIITKDNSISNHTISSKPNGTPVLDIKDRLVGETLGNVAQIEVQFYENKVVITVPKCVKQVEEREVKADKTTFEIFSGGATLTDMFEQAGFVSKGALELSENNMAIYHENHKDKDVFTVCANIEDIDVDMLPKDVTVALVTPVCTDSTPANKVLATAIKNKRNGLPYDEAAIERMERSDSLMYYALKAIEAMNPKTIVFENVVGFTKNPYDESGMSERGVYTLMKTILKAKGYKLSEYIGESHNTIRKRWTMIAHYGSEPISLSDLVINQKLSTVKDHLEIKDEERTWGTVYDFAPSRLLNNTVKIRAVGLDDFRTPTFSTHRTRRTFPILHKKADDGTDLFSEFTPEDIKKIHGLSDNFYLPKENKKVAYAVLGQGVASMFKDIAKLISNHYDNNQAKCLVSNHQKEYSLLDYMCEV